MPKVISEELTAEKYGIRGGKIKKKRKKKANGNLNLIQTALCVGSFKLSKPGDKKLESRYVTGMMDGALYIWNDYKLETIERAHIKRNSKSAVTAMYSHNDAFFTGDKQGKVKIWEANRCYDLERAATEIKKYKIARKKYHNASSNHADDVETLKSLRIKMFQYKYKSILFKKPLICLFTIDLAVGPSSHAWMFNSYDSARPKGPHVDGPIKSELRSLCYKDGKLLIGTKCSSIYEADCQPPRPKGQNQSKLCRVKFVTISTKLFQKNLKKLLKVGILTIGCLGFRKSLRTLRCGKIWIILVNALQVHFQNI